MRACFRHASRYAPRRTAHATNHALRRAARPLSASSELLQRAMCFSLSNKDLADVVDLVRVASGKQEQPSTELAPEPFEVETTVNVPVLSEAGADAPLFQCTLFRCVAAYTGWHTKYESDALALADGVVVALSAPVEGLTRVTGFDLVEQLYARAASEPVLGLSLDPLPDAPDLVLGEDGYESSLLEFFSRVAKVEAALSDWGIIARAMQETGAGPPGMDETATKERLLWSAVSILRRHPDYWILKTTDPEGRPVAIQSEGWLFLFTSPDVALRHSLDAHESAEGLPAMEPHRFSSKMVRDHAHSAPAGELAGLWINPPAKPPPNPTLAGVKLTSDQLRDWYGLVDLYGDKLPAGW